MTSFDHDAPPIVRPRSGDRPSQLVVLLHGYGADGNDLIGLSESWAPMLPDAAFVALHAPEPCSGAPMGRQWFPLTSFDPHDLSRHIGEAAPALDQRLTALLSDLAVDPRRHSLFGFSQGAMMALATGLARDVKPACILGYSGAFRPPHGLAKPIAGAPARDACTWRP
ncbi:MAG: hypothetical protein AAFX39_02320 [Pseudomonadota bacterium]